MKSEAAVFEIANIDLSTSGGPNGQATSQASRTKIAALRRLAHQLLRELQSLSEIQTAGGNSGQMNLEGGVDFYEQVSHFEIELIKNALQTTRGHQAHAAQLLNLNTTTLNSKIKRYKISVNEFFHVYVPTENVGMETRA
jgi:DNA-binding NtrC family response regulator